MLDPDIWEFIVKYNLDDRVMNRLIETLNKRKGKAKDTLQVRSVQFTRYSPDIHISSPNMLGLLCTIA